MKKKQKKLVSILSAIVILALIFFIYAKFNGTTANAVFSDDRIDTFSKCLTEKNVKVYGSTKDSNSLAQKQMFGKTSNGKDRL